MANKNEDNKSTTDIVTSSNLIAQETTIVGDIITQGNIRIEGRVEGGLKSQNKIVIGDSAYVTGDIHALEAEVSGHIDGEIHCAGFQMCTIIGLGTWVGLEVQKMSEMHFPLWLLLFCFVSIFISFYQLFRSLKEDQNEEKRNNKVK